MSITATGLLANHRVVGDVLRSLPTDSAHLRQLDDAALLSATRLAAENRRLAETQSALLAGEIARRSAPVLGQSGLAQRSGFRTVQEMVRVSTGSTARDAGTAVRVGQLMVEVDARGTVDEATGEILTPTRPWLACVAVAVAREGLSLDAAEAISAGLGEPTTITADVLATAAAQLCLEARVLDADRMFPRARQLRDELDAAGVAEREELRRDRRSLTFRKQPDGMSRLVWVMDPETAAAAGELYDRTTSPRRGGPRFVEQDAAALAERVAHDERTTEQLASDVFLELLRQGAAADSSQLLGSGAPVVRLLATVAAGTGRVEGEDDAVSAQTIERHSCSGGVVTVLFDEHGQPLDVGREQRLFTRRQRIALAARDGGCRFPGCDRPPSWTEAHHVQFWQRDHGETAVADGILLCRHHHLLLHNRGWEITRDGSDYRLVPPSEVDAQRRPIAMPSRSLAWLDLRRAAG